MIRNDVLDLLPVRHAVPELLAALEGRGTAVLHAPPGTGKTTLVPLALAGLIGDGPGRRVLVAEPRRMAVRAAAGRMAWLLGEDVGGTVGFAVRGERRAGPSTRIEVVTTGLLLQRLQRDPELAGVDAVLLDECHERHLDADTALAFLVDVRAALRPELGVVAASATSDAEAWARLLTSQEGGGPAPVVRSEGEGHGFTVVHAPPPAGIRPAHGTWVDPALLRHVAATVREALARHEGDVLCFLPGTGEIARTAGLLGGVDAEVLQLHGRASASVQDAVLRGAGPGGRRRVVLSTSVAESSLTVPGVRVVVDAGLAREPRMDHARGLGSLATVPVSAAAATQRAGRSGREAPGTVYRCWSEAEESGRARFPAPEIRIADLAGFALRAACWGDPTAEGLALLDAPPAGALAAARSVLGAIGAVDGAGKATGRGVRMARLGVHPRLGRALLDGSAEVGARRAAEVVALLSEEPPREYGDDLAAAWREARRGGDAYGARWRAEVRRLERAAASEGEGGAGKGGVAGEDAVAGVVTALAFPERVARARESGGHLMVSGSGARLAEGSGLRSAPWLAVAVADRTARDATARVRLAAVVDEAVARRAAGHLLRSGEEVRWEDGDVVARSVERLGAVELTVRPLGAGADPALVREALLDGLRREGTGLLRWGREAVELRERLAFLHGAVGGGWPDVAEEALVERAEEWLEPELSRAARRADLGRIDAGEALRRLLPWASGEAGRLDELAPERIEVPSGSRIRVAYGEGRPVLAVKLQEMFGLAETPRVAGVPVLVHLLSPAGRPAAVTADLASFWRDGYREVRAELRGRYPRHPWPEDPSAAVATRHTSARLRREG
ncbi:ATP-dependent helicase HrpB [Streptomyces sp. R302]|uniref:ATP-dependent helicase HrpB n=1 Tax=unclassified Streptomyces TaxID=2593676 RepID=UPI00145CA757|nr:ATP-dependent helicase HrpB [Streptomyces sp. R301]NML78044.1 ATP-dependent helicase HrpB [Streptomyces sp. R302]